MAKIKYSEPTDYFPKEVYDKYFKGTKKKSTTGAKKKTTTTKKKK